MRKTQSTRTHACAVLAGLLAVSPGFLSGQTPSIDLIAIDAGAIPDGAASLVLARNDYGSDVFLRLTWHVTLRADCEAFASVADPYGRQASPGSCIGIQYLTTKVQTPDSPERAYEIRNLPFVQHVRVALTSLRHARLRLHLASVFSDADTLLAIPRGEVIVMHVGPDYARVVEPMDRLAPPARIDADTSLVIPSWIGGGLFPHRLRVAFTAGVPQTTRDALLDQAGVQVVRDDGRFVDLRVEGDADGCRLRDVMDFYETQSVVMSTGTGGALCGTVEAMTQCPARIGSDCGP